MGISTKRLPLNAQTIELRRLQKPYPCFELLPNRLVRYRQQGILTRTLSEDKHFWRDYSKLLAAGAAQCRKLGLHPSFFAAFGYALHILEARVGIEPTHKGFADLSLTTWVPRPIPANSPRRPKCPGTARIPTRLAREKTQAGRRLERETGLEPATLALARRCSTTELLPRKYSMSISGRFRCGQCSGGPHQRLAL